MSDIFDDVVGFLSVIGKGVYEIIAIILSILLIGAALFLYAVSLPVTILIQLLKE